MTSGSPPAPASAAATAVKKETLTDLCVSAARDALHMAGTAPRPDIGVCIVATVSADTVVPSAACLLQRALGLPEDTPCFDLNAACTGFVYALHTMECLLNASPRKFGLVVGAEALSKVVDWTDRGTCILFGDGAAAAVVECREGWPSISAVLGSRGDDVLLRLPGLGRGEPNVLSMEGTQVFKFAVETVPACMDDTLKKAGLTPADIDFFVFHQANARIIDLAVRKYRIPPEKILQKHRPLRQHRRCQRPAGPQRAGGAGPHGSRQPPAADRLWRRSYLGRCGAGNGLSLFSVKEHTMKKLNELLGTEFPIIQGGMANIATGEFAAACSNAGALGVIATGGMLEADLLRKQIRICKSLTDKPFGVNLMLMNPCADEMAQIIIEEGVQVVTTGAGSPGKYIPAWKEAGIKVLPVVAASILAKRLVNQGADAIIAEGMESGGHVGEMTTMALVPQVIDTVDVPVIAAGGIADGRQAAAAFALGACGIQVGTCLLTSLECPIHENYKLALLKAKDSDTTVTGRSIGGPVRVLKNKMAREYLALEKAWSHAGGIGTRHLRRSPPRCV